MRIKNSNVIRLRNAKIYTKVKSILSKHNNNNSFVVGVSGGSDSLALAALTKEIATENKYKFFLP